MGTSAGGKTVNSTQHQFTIDFIDADLSLEQREIIQAYLLKLNTDLHEHLDREVPKRYVASQIGNVDFGGNLLIMAHVLADHLGDPTAFAVYADNGVWTGVVESAGFAVNVRISSDKGPSVLDDLPLMVTTGVIATEPLTHDDALRAQAAADAVAKGIWDRLNVQFLATAPVVTSVEIPGTPRPAPASFYPRTDALDALAAQFTRGGGRSGWQDNVRLVVRSIDPNTRAELRMITRERRGQLTTRVDGVFRRVGDSAPPITDADRARWQAIVDEASAAMAKATDSLGAAPTFSVSAPIEAVAPRVRALLNAGLPSTPVTSNGSTLWAAGFTMGEDVLGTLSVSFTKVGEWETEVSITGKLWGKGLPRDARESRRRFRDAAASMAAQMRDELARELAAPPSSRPSVGIE